MYKEPFILDPEIKQAPSPTMPDYIPVACINEDCGWSGKVGDCPIGWEQESWETERYQVALCPVCGEEIEI